MILDVKQKNANPVFAWSCEERKQFVSLSKRNNSGLNRFYNRIIVVFWRHGQRMLY
jgi:hypothetical protein